MKSLAWGFSHHEQVGTLSVFIVFVGGSPCRGHCLLSLDSRLAPFWIPVLWNDQKFLGLIQEMGGENACVNRVAEVMDEYLENSFREIPAVVALMPHRLFEPQDKEGSRRRCHLTPKREVSSVSSFISVERRRGVWELEWIEQVKLTVLVTPRT